MLAAVCVVDHGDAGRRSRCPSPGGTAEQRPLEQFRQDSGGGIVVRIPVVYDADGAFTVEGVTDAQWQLLTGVPFGGLCLLPEVVRGFRSAGITGAQVRTASDGIHLAVNGKELPAVGWGRAACRHW